MHCLRLLFGCWILGRFELRQPQYLPIKIPFFSHLFFPIFPIHKMGTPHHKPSHRFSHRSPHRFPHRSPMLRVTIHCPMTRRPSCSIHAAIRRREFMSGSLKTALEPLVIVTRSFPSRTMPSVDLHTYLRLWPNLGDLVDPLARIFSR